MAVNALTLDSLPPGLHRWHKELEALRDLVRFLIPIIAGSFINVLADRWTLAFVGHWDYADRSHYDGASIGKMYSNITGLSLGVSATIGLATFCSQAHGAGRSVEQNPVFVRRALLLLSFIFGFAATAAFAGEPLLVALGQPPAVARTSARFAQIQLFGLPFFWLSGAANIALNSTKRTRPGLVMNVVSSIAQIVMCVLLSHPQLGAMGYLGVAMGRSLGGLVSFSAIAVYVRRYNLQGLVWQLHPESEPVLKPGAMRSYLRVSVPSALVVWSEWWAFEVLAVLVGLTPEAELNLAAHGTMFNFIVVFYMCWTGACTAVCTILGNLLGAGRNSDIPPLLRAAFGFSFCTSMIVALGYEAGKGWLAAAFTEDILVQERINSSSIGIVLSVPLYAQLMTCYGALRGANYQMPGILGTLVGYWIVGLPLGGLLGDVLHWPSPLVGVWIGNVVALLIAATWVLVAVFFRIDWSSVRRVDGVRDRLVEQRQDRCLDREIETARSSSN